MKLKEHIYFTLDIRVIRVLLAIFGSPRSYSTRGVLWEHAEDHHDAWSMYRQMHVLGHGDREKKHDRKDYLYNVVLYIAQLHARVLITYYIQA